MLYLIVLLIAVVVVVLVMRAAVASGRPEGRSPGRSAPRRPGPPQSTRPLAPDDDPEFLRELERRAKRKEGPTP